MCPRWPRTPSVLPSVLGWFPGGFKVINQKATCWDIFRIVCQLKLTWYQFKSAFIGVLYITLPRGSFDLEDGDIGNILHMCGVPALHNYCWIFLDWRSTPVPMTMYNLHIYKFILFMDHVVQNYPLPHSTHWNLSMQVAIVLSSGKVWSTSWWWFCKSSPGGPSSEGPPARAGCGLIEQQVAGNLGGFWATPLVNTSGMPIWLLIWTNPGMMHLILNIIRVGMGFLQWCLSKQHPC